MTEAAPPHFPGDLTLVEAVVRSEDVSRLTPAQLADYSLAVQALQTDGTETYLSDVAYAMATEVVDRTHYDLALASADALAKEMIPGGLGGTNQQGGRMLSTAPVSAVCAVLRDKGDYREHLPTNFVVGITNELSLTAQDRAFTAMVYTLRETLRDQRDEPEQALAIAADIADLARVFFAEQRRLDEVAGRQTSTEVWEVFAWETTAYLDMLAQGDRQATVILASMLINAAHKGTDIKDGRPLPMAMRFTNQYVHVGKDTAYQAVIQAAAEVDHDALLPLTTSRGVLFWAYLSGKQKSLDRLPADRPVPAVFTGLLG